MSQAVPVLLDHGGESVLHVVLLGRPDLSPVCRRRGHRVQSPEGVSKPASLSASRTRMPASANSAADSSPRPLSV